MPRLSRKSRSQAPLPTGSLAAGTALAGLLGASLSADIYSSFTSADTHGYIVEDMPDFDQKRVELPNEGSCYCGPAAIANLLGYVSTHGYPGVAPGVPATSWSDPTDYDDLTALLAEIGTGITSPGPRPDPCGTGVRDLRDTLRERLTYRFIVDADAFDRDDPSASPPRFEDLSQRLARDGAIGIALAGRYRGSTDALWPVAWPTHGLEDRVGGHYETVNRAFAGPLVRRIGLRNPSSSDDKTSQSRFATRYFDVQDTTLLLGTRHVTMDVFGDPYQVSIDHDGDDSTDEILEWRIYGFEGYITLTPRWFCGWGESSGTVERVVGDPGFGVPDRPIERWMHDGALTDVVIGPEGHSIFAAGGGRLFRTDRGAGATPFPIQLPPNSPITGSLAIGDDGRLHAASLDRILTIDTRSNEVVGSAQLPGEGTSVTVFNGLVHALVPEMELVAVIDPTQGALVDEFRLPDDALVDADSEIAMLPNGIFMLLTDGVLNPMRITADGLARMWLPIPRDGDWDRMIPDVDDMMLLQDRQGLVEAYRVTPKGFERLGEHVFDGRQIAGRMTLPNATSNFSNAPGIAVPDDRSDVETVPDCDGDLDFDGDVDSADLGVMLAEWGSEHSRADLDDSGRVDSGDLGLLLGFFGNCD